MKITVIGPGAMGLLFGGKLAACADVSLVGSNAANLEKINKEGVTIKRGDSSVTRMVPAYMAGTCTEPVDVVMIFTKAYQILRVQDLLRKAPGGFTSIYSDIKNGRKTEADFICGAVVRAAQDQGLRVPVQETILRLVHAMEER